MVGTAVYQLGLRLPHPGEEFQRIEAGRAEHRAAARQRRQQPRDQPVDVEQRHDVEAAVGVRELERFARCCAAEIADIALRQRHDLGPRRRARGVQDQRDVVAAAAPGRGGVAVCLGPRARRRRRRLRRPASASTMRTPSFCATSIAGRDAPASTISALALRSVR